MSIEKNKSIRAYLTLIHDALKTDDLFGAHYYIDDLVNLTAGIDKDLVSLNFPMMKQADESIQMMIESNRPKETCFTFIRALAPLDILQKASVGFKKSFFLLGRHYLENDYSALESSAFVRMFNSLVHHDDDFFTRAQAIQFSAMAKFLENLSDDYKIDRDVVDTRLHDNARILSMIGTILYPVENLKEKDPVKYFLSARKLANPFYEFMLSHANRPGIISNENLIENLNWLVTKRGAQIEFSEQHELLLCNTHALAKLTASIIDDRFRGIISSVQSPTAGSASETIKIAQNLIGFMKKHLADKELSTAASTIFAGLLACYSHHTDPFLDEPDPEIVNFFAEAWKTIDIDRVSDHMKKRFQTVLALYIKSYHPQDLSKLSARYRDSLLTHDLGL